MAISFVQLLRPNLEKFSHLSFSHSLYLIHQHVLLTLFQNISLIQTSLRHRPLPLQPLDTPHHLLPGLRRSPAPCFHSILFFIEYPNGPWKARPVRSSLCSKLKWLLIALRARPQILTRPVRARVIRPGPPLQSSSPH